MRPYEAWVHSRGFFVERGESPHRLCNIFKGGFFPQLSYDVLELAMAWRWILMIYSRTLMVGTLVADRFLSRFANS